MEFLFLLLFFFVDNSNLVDNLKEERSEPSKRLALKCQVPYWSPFFIDQVTRTK